MDLGLGGKTALIVGGSSGIGKATAKRLIDEGCRVAICARDDARRNAAVAELSQGKKDVAVEVAVDVSDPAAVQTCVAKVHAALGRIDIMVFSAGTHIRATVDTATPDILERQLREKVIGAITMSQAVIPIMRGQKDGRIVNIVGQAARHPHPDRFPSGVSNGAQMSLTKSIADAVARDNIRVNAVCPQYIESDLLNGVIEREMKKHNIDRATASAGFTRALPLGRTGTVEEVADVVAFVVSDRANFITGTAISVDGGYHRYVFG
jgi:3-oxoacyl-[acyl-carrier protein] reductase